MEYLQKNKKKLIIILFSISLILLAIRLIFFLQDGTNNQVELILIYTIAIISFIYILIYLIPVKQPIIQVLNKYRDIIIFLLAIFYGELIFTVDNKLQFSSITIFSILFMLSLLGVITLLFKQKVKHIFMIVFTIYFTIYLIAQDIYHDIFHDFFSFKEIVSLKAGLEFTGGVIHFRFIHFLLIVIASITIYLLVINKTDNQVKLTKKNNKLLLIPLLIFIAMNINAEYPSNPARLYLSDHYLYYSRYSNSKFIGRYGAINYTFRDFFTSIFPKRPNKKDLKDIEEFFKDHEKNHVDNEYTGVFENKNFIFIAAESFDGIAINEELTPNLLRLRDEGIYLKNNYVPVYPRTTCDSEIIFNTSLVPSISAGPTCYMFNKNTYSHSLANLFINEGYVANAFHSNRKEFYTRNVVYKGLGFQNFYGQHELDLSETEKRYDTLFIEKGQNLMIKDNEKFFTFITTLSGHSPYNKDNLAGLKHYDEVDRVYGDSIPKEIKYYIATQIELDLFVGELFEILEEKNLIDNTVIMLTGDHYPYTIETNTYTNYTDIYEEYLKNQTPAFIWGNGIEPTVVEKLSSSFDFLPTIANLFNLDANYTHYFGNDIFSDDYEPVVFYKDYSWFDGENYVLNGEKLAGSGIDDYIQLRTEEIYQYYDISLKILQTDYFNKKKN